MTNLNARTGQLLFLAIVAWACTAGSAWACVPKLRITFSDGATGCFTDFPLSKVQAPGQSFSLETAIPQHGYYHLSLPREPKACPAAIGLSAPHGTSVSGGISGPREHARITESLLACQKRAGQAAEGAPCQCIIAIADGTSPLSRSDFERMATEALQAK